MSERPESPAGLHFPEDGVRAVDVPVTQVSVDARNGLVEFDNGDPSRRLSDKLETGESIHSIVLYTDVDLKLKDVYDDPVGVQAGWTVLQGIPDVEKFRLDMTLDKTPGGYTLTPEEVPLEIYLFTSDYEQIDVSNKKSRGNRVRTGLDITSTSYEAELVVPASPYDQERFKVQNTGSNNLDARLKTVDGGEEYVEAEKTGKSGSFSFENLPSSDFYVLELRESGNGDTTADLVYRGESR